MVTGLVIVGSGSVGMIVCGPEAMLKAIVLGVVLALASRIAWRSEPLPLSPVLVTRKVAISRRGSAASTQGWNLAEPPERRRGHERVDIGLAPW
jgi:hypothetical protein